MKLDVLQLVDRIVDLIGQYRIQGENDRFAEAGRNVLREQIARFVIRAAPIQFILPGFPCKSPNKTAKSFGSLPDFGEAMAIRHLDGLCGQIKHLYGPGCELTILSDGATFADLVGVSEAEKMAYCQRLRELTVTEFIRWADLSDLLDKSLPDADMVTHLTGQANGELAALDRFKEGVSRNLTLSSTHDKLCGYLYNDVRPERLSGVDHDTFMAALSENAYTMMLRGQALSVEIAKRYPQHIRLSVHEYDNSGDKLSIGLFPGANQATVPWHSVPLRKQDQTVQLVPHALIDKSRSVLVTYKSQNWLYLQVDDPVLLQFRYRLVKAPSFGLEIEDPSQIGLHHFKPAFLTGLAQTFGFVLFRNAQFSQQIELTAFAERFGDVYHWQFGAVQVVKPKDRPDGFVHSIEKLPLHWDLSMLPAGSPHVAANPNFSAKQFLLYCKVPPAVGEGQTTMVDCRTAMRLAGVDTISQWRQVTLTYDTKLTYFGGTPRSYKLIQPHPETGEPVFRYQEGSESDLQKFTVTAEGMPQIEIDALIDRLNSLCYDPRCLLAHDWQANDLLLVDNLHTLHGRLPMSWKSKARELWRVQMI
jgi:pyoverdine/dityrosine biosynthesis protein Dit1/alpha-ketoglutarate-dependent taurine dioxygenase